jgi:LysR family transcriptional regulator, nitrogen assimilation regulatory protein
MNLKQLEYFIAVAELGSFTRAALTLDISQPSLSRQVRLLEVELRHTLLHRNGRGIELTPAGQCLLEHGQTVQQTVKHALSALNDLRTDPSGRVVVGLPSRVAHVLTAPLVRAFRNKFPHGSISVAEGMSSVLHEWLLMGRVDVALLFDPLRSADLELHPVHSEELVLVGLRSKKNGPSTSLPLKQLRRYPLILPRMPNATRAILNGEAAKQGIAFNIVAEVDTTQNILDLVGNNMGFGILPHGAVKGATSPERFAVARIHTPTMREHLFLSTSRRRRHNRLAVEVGKLILAADVPALLG